MARLDFSEVRANGPWLVIARAGLSESVMSSFQWIVCFIAHCQPEDGDLGARPPKEIIQI